MNVLDLPFIQCQFVTGQVRSLSPMEALSAAKSIRKIVGYPLDVVGSHRYLTALCGWARSKSADPCDFLGSSQGRRPFFLFGDAPFYQVAHEATCSKEKAVGYLFHEVPTGENWIGTRSLSAHGGSCGACLSCCARGLVRVPCFTTTGGGGFCPGLHGSPPGYIIPVVGNLWESLLLSDRPSTSPPSWEGGGPKNFESGEQLAALTWMPRAITLFRDNGGRCFLCGGESADLVVKIHFDNNVFKGVGQKSYTWLSDPHVIYRSKKGVAAPANLKVTFQMDAPPIRGHNAKLICDLIAEDVDEDADKDYVRAIQMGYAEVGVYGILMSTNVIKGEFGYQMDVSTGRLLDEGGQEEGAKKKIRVRSDEVLKDAADRLTLLTEGQLEVLRRGSRRHPNKEVFEIFTGLYRSGPHKLVNKVAWSRVVFAYARHPKWGSVRPDVLGWESASVRDDKFESFMRGCESSGCGVDWKYVIQQMDRYCVKAIW